MGPSLSLPPSALTPLSSQKQPWQPAVASAHHQIPDYRWQRQEWQTQRQWPSDTSHVLPFMVPFQYPPDGIFSDSNPLTPPPRTKPFTSPAPLIFDEGPNSINPLTLTVALLLWNLSNKEDRTGKRPQSTHPVYTTNPTCGITWNLGQWHPRTRKLPANECASTVPHVWPICTPAPHWALQVFVPNLTIMADSSVLCTKGPKWLSFQYLASWTKNSWVMMNNWLPSCEFCSYPKDKSSQILLTQVPINSFINMHWTSYQ